ncbi:hypothetical protein [Belnapia rosea]|uniref:hypothetical protein n=1 Tax=Belnapia rosea TaxID=938405 RepID=UPI000885DE9D|nr:hypothetical protein [Belnapia rosea]SDB32516.1 hypothetical protein SAMN02927895_01148 [Belnapia rosea]
MPQSAQATEAGPSVVPAAVRADHMPAWLQLLLAGLFGLAHVAILLRLGLAMAGDAFWQRPPGDLAMATIGAEALLRDGWHFPLSATALLSSSAPLPIVYTDSMPWLVVLLKALGLSADRVAPMGLCILLGFVLQPVAALVLLRAAGVRRWEVLLAGIAFASFLPAWILRLHMHHLALASHWALLLALALAVQAVRQGVSGAVIAGFAALGALVIGLHAYLWAMVAGIALGGLIADAARHPAPGSALRGGLGFAAFLVASVLAAWLLGYRTENGAPTGFGFFSMNLLSPLVPQLSGLFGTLPAGPVTNGILDATGGQYEGFNYLGLGILLLLAAAALHLARHRVQAPPGLWRAALPLGLVLLGCLLFALSNRIILGSLALPAIPLFPWLDNLVSQLRASGRFFWPLAYLLPALALAVLARARHRQAVGAMLAGFVVLQAADMARLDGMLRATFRAPMSADFDPTPLRQPGLEGRMMTLHPPLACTRPGGWPLDFSQFAMAAMRAGMRVEGGPVTRLIGGRSCEAARRDALAGLQDRSGLHVFLAGQWPEALLLRAAATAPCRGFEMGLACGDPVLIAGFPQAVPAPPPPLQPGAARSFAAGGDGIRLLGTGWSMPERWGVRFVAPTAELVLPMPADRKGPARLTLRLRGPAAPGRTVIVEAEERELARGSIAGSRGITLAVPPEALQAGLLTLRFVVPPAGGDALDDHQRELGLEAISLDAG